MDNLYSNFNNGLGKSDKVFADLTRYATQYLLELDDILDEIGTVKAILIFQQSVWEQLYKVTKEDLSTSQNHGQPTSAADNRHAPGAGPGSGSTSQERVIPLVDQDRSAQDFKCPGRTPSPTGFDKCPWDPENCRTEHLQKHSVLPVAEHIENNAKILKEKVRPKNSIRNRWPSHGMIFLLIK